MQLGSLGEITSYVLTLHVSVCLSFLAANTDSRSDGKSKKISDEYAAKLNSMQTELKKLQAAKREHTKLLRNQSHYETQLRTLRSDLASLKQLKVCTTNSYCSAILLPLAIT